MCFSVSRKEQQPEPTPRSVCFSAIPFLMLSDVSLVCSSSTLLSRCVICVDACGDKELRAIQINIVNLSRANPLRAVSPLLCMSSRPSPHPLIMEVLQTCFPSFQMLHEPFYWVDWWSLWRVGCGSIKAKAEIGAQEILGTNCEKPGEFLFFA